MLILTSARPAGANAGSAYAALYLGSTSAGTQIEFRLSGSGRWVRGFRFGQPTVTCSDDPTDTGRLDDGSFPLRGLRVTGGGFSGYVHPFQNSPDDPVQYQSGGSVTGQFNADRAEVTGTLTGVIYGCNGPVEPLTFKAKRIRSLPADPVSAGRYAGSIPGRSNSLTGVNVRFRVSSSGRRVVGFRLTHLYVNCVNSGASRRLSLAFGYPRAGLRQNGGGAFAGTLFSRLGSDRQPAGTRIRVNLLFLSSRDATGTFRLLSRRCRYETLPWNAELGTG